MDLFGPTWSGPPFRLFGTTHLVMLAVVAVGGALLVLLGGRLGERGRRVVRVAMAVVLGLNILGWHVWRLAVGRWSTQDMLPLHLCSVLGPVTVVALLTRNPTTANLAWLLGVPGALQALLTPEVAPFDFPHYRVVNSWVAHGGIVWAGLWLVFVERLRPSFAWVVRCFLLLNAYAVGVFFLNRALGTNYLYVNRKPEFSSILDLLPPWPTYLLILEGLVVALMLLFWLMGRRRSSR